MAESSSVKEIPPLSIHVAAYTTSLKKELFRIDFFQVKGDYPYCRVYRQRLIRPLLCSSSIEEYPEEQNLYISKKNKLKKCYRRRPPQDLRLYILPDRCALYTKDVTLGRFVYYRYMELLGDSDHYSSPVTSSSESLSRRLLPDCRSEVDTTTMHTTRNPMSLLPITRLSQELLEYLFKHKQDISITMAWEGFYQKRRSAWGNHEQPESEFENLKERCSQLEEQNSSLHQQNRSLKSELESLMNGQKVLSSNEKKEGESQSNVMMVMHSSFSPGEEMIDNEEGEQSTFSGEKEIIHKLTKLQTHPDQILHRSIKEKTESSLLENDFDDATRQFMSIQTENSKSPPPCTAQIQTDNPTLVHASTNTNDSLQLDLDEMKSENASLIKQLETSKDTNTKLMIQINELTKLQETANDYMALQSEHELLKNRFDEQVENCQHAKQTIEGLTTTIRAKQREIDAMKVKQSKGGQVLNSKFPLVDDISISLDVFRDNAASFILTASIEDQSVCQRFMSAQHEIYQRVIDEVKKIQQEFAFVLNEDDYDSNIVRKQMRRTFHKLEDRILSIDIDDIVSSINEEAKIYEADEELKEGWSTLLSVCGSVVLSEPRLRLEFEGNEEIVEDVSKLERSMIMDRDSGENLRGYVIYPSLMKIGSESEDVQLKSSGYVIRCYNQHNAAVPFVVLDEIQGKPPSKDKIPHFPPPLDPNADLIRLQSSDSDDSPDEEVSATD